LNTKKVTKPERPGDEECCGGGCTPCVWDFYYDQLMLWNEQEAQLKNAEKSEKPTQVPD
jgi:hypothetical protein